MELNLLSIALTHPARSTKRQEHLLLNGIQFALLVGRMIAPEERRMESKSNTIIIQCQ